MVSFMSKIAIDIDNTICNTSDFFGLNALEKTSTKVIMMETNKTKDYSNNKIFKTGSWKEIYNYITSNEVK